MRAGASGHSEPGVHSGQVRGREGQKERKGGTEVRERTEGERGGEDGNRAITHGQPLPGATSQQAKPRDYGTQRRKDFGFTKRFFWKGAWDRGT